MAAGWHFLARLTVFCCLLLSVVRSDSAERYIMDDDDYEARVIAAAAGLQSQGRLRSFEDLRSQIPDSPGPIRFAPPRTAPIPAADLYDLVRESTLTIGILFRENEDRDWEWLDAGGYAVTADGIVATCRHVIEDDLPEEAREAYVAAADATGRVYPVLEVLRADEIADVCLIQIDAQGLTPLPVRAGARPGERIYCLSHPNGHHYMLTEGVIARVVRLQGQALSNANELPRDRVIDAEPVTYLNITAEYAPGSSGGPVVDEHGNAVAHVVSISDAGVLRGLTPLGQTTSTKRSRQNRSRRARPVKKTAANSDSDTTEASETEAATGLTDDRNLMAVPGIAIRFCVAAEEVLRVGGVAAGGAPPHTPAAPTKRPK